SAAHTPGKDGVALKVVDHEAIDEDDDPREAGDGSGGGSRRPVVGRLHVAKGMAGGKGRAGKWHRGVHQACQLLDRREAPALAITDGQSVAMTLSISPGEGRH